MKIITWTDKQWEVFFGLPIFMKVIIVGEILDDKIKTPNRILSEWVGTYSGHTVRI